jgi:hypothetical protein
VIKPILVFLIVVALVVVALWSGQRRLIYFPDPATPRPAGATREVELRTSDGLRLVGWLVPPAGADRKMAVLVTPGNAGHREHRAPLAGALSGAGFTVLVLDYRGYGGNPGSPSETGLARDARAALAHLTGTAGFTPGRIIYFGESLGAGVATGLAAEHPPAALVLRSPFVDLASAGRTHYPWLPVRLLLRDRYPVADRLADMRVPTTVIYGTADSVVPAAQSRTVAERAAGPVRMVELPGADHNDPALTHGPQIVRAVVETADRIDG